MKFTKYTKAEIHILLLLELAPPPPFACMINCLYRQTLPTIHREKPKRQGSEAQRHILRDRRPSTAVPASLKCDGSIGIEIVYGEEKNILYWAD
jgi:hypothetical protein